MTALQSCSNKMGIYRGNHLGDQFDIQFVQRVLETFPLLPLSLMVMIAPIKKLSPSLRGTQYSLTNLAWWACLIENKLYYSTGRKLGENCHQKSVPNGSYFQSPSSRLTVLSPFMHLSDALQRIGEEWVTDLSKLHDLLPLAEDAQLMREVHHVKQVREEQGRVIC